MLETTQQTNLAQLERRYFAGRAAGQGGDLLDRLSEGKLAALLRSHLLSPISSSETGPRDRIDALLSYYGLLEIGALAGCIPSPLPSGLAHRAQRHLSRPSVRRYYEHFYPLVLPQLFRQRIEGGGEPEAVANEIFLFMTFLQISDLATGEPVRSFLWFLDDGQSRDSSGTWWSLSDFLETLSNKRALVQRMTRPEKRWGPLERSLHGFIRFLNFARTLDSFLQSCPSPLLRSAFWHHHAYWFLQLGGQVGGVIAVAIEQYRSWVGQSKRRTEKRLVQYTNEDMDESQLALRRLTSGIYRSCLESRAFRDLTVEAEERSSRFSSVADTPVRMIRRRRIVFDDGPSSTLDPSASEAAEPASLVAEAPPKALESEE